MEGNVYFRKEKQRIRPGLKGSRGQGLWALASLVALLASGLGLSSEAAQESEGRGGEVRQALWGRVYPAP